MNLNFISPSRILYFCITLLLAGCIRPQGVLPGEQPPPFLAATLAPTSIPIMATSFLPGGDSINRQSDTPSPDCQDQLSFVNDITIPDGTEVEAGSTIDKRWEVKNSGTCNWDDRYHIRLIAGPDLGAQTEHALFPARSGSNATIRTIFKAPADSGTYRSAWQAFNPDDQPFGDPFYIEIVVK